MTAIAPLSPADQGRITAAPGQLPAVVQVFWLTSGTDSPGEFLASSLPVVQAALEAELAAVVVPEVGRWAVRQSTAKVGELPVDLLAEVNDAEQVRSGGPWAAAPLHQPSTTGEVLLVRGADQSSAVDALAAALGAALSIVRHTQRRAARVERLETILKIAQQWYQTQEVRTLLEQMAEAATRLFDADRASIFLWDRHNKLLVGRPALGVEGGELRIADDAGIVGQVVQSGQPRRLMSNDDQDQINREVDAQLGYQTHTLLCVPLRSAGGELVGAFELINKRRGNFTEADEAGLIELASHAAVALANTQQREELLAARRQLAEQAAEGVKLVGESPAIEALRSTVRRVADTELAVLILGENGTGKEVVAQSIHYLSARRDQPFVAVNCAAIAETLLESELFGHEKGAFTDAHEARAGKFELANGGTLFLDEIGDLSLGGQAKLLRVLEEKIVVRVGGSASIPTDARVVAATNQDLGQMVQQKKFRQDLFFRLNVVSLVLPPLRERGDDILLLADHFLADFSRKARRRSPKFTAAARKRMLGHHWPGNVRELRNLMERLAYLSQEDSIDADELAFIITPAGEQPAAVAMDQSLSDATGQFQIDYIERAIKRNGGNMSAAAEKLGLHRSNLYRKMRQLGMEAGE